MPVDAREQCPECGGNLEDGLAPIVGAARGATKRDAGSAPPPDMPVVRCVQCGAEYPVRDGVLND